MTSSSPFAQDPPGLIHHTENPVSSKLTQSWGPRQLAMLFPSFSAHRESPDGPHPTTRPSFLTSGLMNAVPSLWNPRGGLPSQARRSSCRLTSSRRGCKRPGWVALMQPRARQGRAERLSSHHTPQRPAGTPCRVLAAHREQCAHVGVGVPPW